MPRSCLSRSAAADPTLGMTARFGEGSRNCERSSWLPNSQCLMASRRRQPTRAFRLHSRGAEVPEMKPKIWTPIVTLLLLAACSTNPVTGKKEFNIVSEQQELAMGQQAHQQTIAQFGIYDEKPE